MKLWLIERIERTDYDEHDGAVIRADTEEEARAIARANLFPHEIWEGIGVTCKELTADGEPGVILDSFNAG